MGFVGCFYGCFLLPMMDFKNIWLFSLFAYGLYLHFVIGGFTGVVKTLGLIVVCVLFLDFKVTVISAGDFEVINIVFFLFKYFGVNGFF